MFASVSNNLPKTSYIKMIDIWLFGGLSVPFIVIGILINLDHLVMRETNVVIELQKEDKTGLAEMGWPVDRKK